MRDATGQTGFRLMREQFAGFRSPDARVRRTLWKILAVQAVLLGAAIVGGVWWVYPVFWLAPYLTVWRVINRLRSIAEHGGMDASSDRRATTHTVRQTWWARSCWSRSTSGGTSPTTSTRASRCAICPSTTGRLSDAGYVTPALEYPGLPGAVAGTPRGNTGISATCEYVR